MHYNKLILKPYNNEACYKAYCNLVANPKDPDAVGEAVESSIPVLGIVLKSVFRFLRADSPDYDDILSYVPYSLYLYLISDTFYLKFYNNEESHFAWLFGVFRFEILNSLKASSRGRYQGPEAGEVIRRNAIPGYYLNYLPSSIDLAILAKQIPVLVMKEVEKKIRFREGSDYRVCMTALQSFVEGQILPWYLLDQIVPHSRVCFLVDHVKIHIRSVLLAHREEFENLTSLIGEELRTYSDDSAQDFVSGGSVFLGSEEMTVEDLVDLGSD